MTYMVRIIEEDIYRLVTREGFEETFWKTLRQWREEDPKVTQRSVFNYLNDRYEETFGEPKFVSFDSFRMFRDRKRRK